MTSNIMIVDDSALDRKIMRNIIEMKLQNICVFEAEDGININEKLVSNSIHMCILDIVMPFKDGFEVLEYIKDDYRTMDIPVIVCTGIDDIQAVERALTLGAYDYFSKPLSEDAMKISLPLKIKNAIQLLKRNEEISYLSYYDVLTGLYNRRFYEEEIKRLDSERNLPISIIVGDVNGLKLVNDAFGHNKGDELLQNAALSIKNICRSCDIIARWGGDEFIILLPKTKKNEAEIIVNRIKAANLNQFVNNINVSISFGWDTKTQADEDVSKIIKSAEDIMYKNKANENKIMRGKTINTIMNTFYEKFPKEEQHSVRVSRICQMLGEKLGCSDDELNQLKLAGLFHDIGKIVIEDGILNKPGGLSEQERDELERHPEIGYRILSSSYELSEVANCVVAHHERWDGNGYPKGLKGDAIPKLARIVAIAESFDTMISDQPYRETFSEEEAFNEIQKNAGIKFDPDMVRLFIEKECENYSVI